MPTQPTPHQLPTDRLARRLAILVVVLLEKCRTSWDTREEPKGPGPHPFAALGSLPVPIRLGRLRVSPAVQPRHAPPYNRGKPRRRLRGAAAERPMSCCGGSSPMLPPTSAHPSALSYRRDGTHSRPPSRSAGRSYPPPPPQGGAPQRHHRCPSHLYGETQAPGCKTPTGTFSGGGLGYRNFLPFGAQGEFSEPIIKIRQIALNSNSPKWPFGMILISGPRIERADRWSRRAAGKSGCADHHDFGDPRPFAVCLRGALKSRGLALA